MAAGHFSAPNVIDIAAGAPQHSGSGKVRSAPLVSGPDVVSRYSDVLLSRQVYIFKIDGSSLVKSFQASGKMVRVRLWSSVPV